MRTILSAVVAAYLVLTGNQVAAQATSEERAVNLKIDSETLAGALDQWAAQTGVQLVSPSWEIAQKIAATPLKGPYTPREALKKLLNGTPLTGEWVSHKAVAIREKSPIPPAALQSTGQVDAVESTQRKLRVAQLAEGERSGVELTAAMPAKSTASAGRRSGEPEEGVEELEEVVVTGTHIRGLENRVSPTITFSRQDIEQSGYATLDKFIESLPQNFGGGASQDSRSVSEEGALNRGAGSAVNLRGLGSGSTLVLVNGRRLAPAGQTGFFTDISMIPAQAVERVEILTDGASAIYGSDAVGGVVNFILRSEFSGAETGVRYGGVTEGHSDEVRLSQSLGGVWDQGSGLLLYEYLDRDDLAAKDRDFALSEPLQDTALIPGQRRHSVFGDVRFKLNERTSTFANALYSTRSSSDKYDELGFGTISDVEADSDQLQSTIGVRFNVAGDWSLELAPSFSTYQLTYANSNPLFELPFTVDTKTRVFGTDAVMDGTLVGLASGSVRAAFGTSYRDEKYENREIGFFGDIADLGAKDRDVVAAFAELHVPLIGANNRMRGVEALELTLAGRYERYSDFGDDTTPKVGLRWQPAESVNVRATWGKSFKAPNLSDLRVQDVVLLIEIPDLMPLSLFRLGTGNANLTAEKSTSWTAGLDYRPGTGGFSASVTYFDIRFEDRIAHPAFSLLEFSAAPNQFGDLYVQNPTVEAVNSVIDNADQFFNGVGPFDPIDVVAIGDNRVHNIASNDQRGVDLNLAYRFDAGVGRFGFGLAGTYISDYEQSVTPLSGQTSVLSIYGRPVDLRVRGSVTWSTDRLNTALFINYQDDYDDLDPTHPAIASWTTVDGTVSYDISRKAKIALSLQNILDEEPPFTTSSPLGYDAANADPLGRFIALELSKTW